MLQNMLQVFLLPGLLKLKRNLCYLTLNFSLPGKTSSGDKVSLGLQSSADAFLEPKYRPLFSFIMRPEAGQGDTIDK